MFYSEALLSKTGPLARVWLSANIERRLSKTHVIQSNLSSSIEAMTTASQAPMALRLSGQLLLGVVRIYSRKARYLLEDCNEALMKIKMVRCPCADPDPARRADCPLTCRRPSGPAATTISRPTSTCRAERRFLFPTGSLPTTTSIFFRRRILRF